MTRKQDMDEYEREVAQLASSIYDDDQRQYQDEGVSPIIWAIIVIAAVLAAAYFYF